MMLCLLIYSYATGVFSSRKIEQSTWNNVEARYICGGNLHPDHDTICTFRKENGSLSECVGALKLRDKKSYGFRTFNVLQIALFHDLAKLPIPPPAHTF